MQTHISSHNIFIGKEILTDIESIIQFEKYSQAFVIIDKNIPSTFSKKIILSLSLKTSLLELHSGEKEKTISTVQKIWNAMHNVHLDRKSLVINIGGGVVTDMGGFAASTYMRGIDFINVPTTLLSQVDASVGGKTGIDFAGIKNLIGTFTQPKAVLIDVRTLQSLPKREFVSGFGEIIKHGLIADANYFSLVTKKHPLEFTSDELIEIITKSCEIKAKIVSVDEKESGARKLLNFGHTIGHAIEALRIETTTPLLHGEAVSVGMVAAAEISYQVGLLQKKEKELIKNSLEATGLPVTVSGITVDTVLSKMKSDKKNENGKLQFTLLKGIGNAVYNQEVSDSILRNAIEHIVE